MNDDRLKRQDGSNRQSRAMQDRDVTHDRETTDALRFEERLKLLEKSHLPDLPPRDGIHFMWASMTNLADLQAKLRFGYEFATPDDLKGITFDNQNTATVEGRVQVNEMVALKVAHEDYIAIMREFHGKRPREAEAQLKESRDKIAAQAEAAGSKVIKEADDGFN